MKDLSKQDETNLAKKQFKEVKEKIFNLLSFQKDNSEELEFLNKTTILFVNNQHANYAAYADFDYKYFDFRNEDYIHAIVYNIASTTDNTNLFIHELAHLICIQYNILNENQSGHHCLEFAIINYCIQWKAIYQKINIHKSFFRSSDIKDDKSFPTLCVNVCQFDSFIKNIEWQTLSELVRESKRLAKLIRQKSIK
ncbi:hypothetical protein [Delftia sp. Cs1-4]|uniref:hypothetical protein n=1 Tax=Delftia sp. (strain Cs1-4) TaxID=742013 RepID=UPI0012F514A8|nr:hypothetical protein [Delftia sp. Cs1-4]